LGRSRARAAGRRKQEQNRTPVASVAARKRHRRGCVRLRKWLAPFVENSGSGAPGCAARTRTGIWTSYHLCRKLDHELSHDRRRQTIRKFRL